MHTHDPRKGADKDKANPFRLTARHVANSRRLLLFLVCVRCSSTSLLEEHGVVGSFIS